MKVAFTLLLLLLVLVGLVLGDGQSCQAFNNPISGNSVNPNDWPHSNVQISGPVGSLNPRYNAFFSWCAPAMMTPEGSKACPEAGYVQLFSDDGCGVNCDEILQAPQMNSDGNNDVTVAYNCKNFLNEAQTVQIKITCAAGTPELTGNIYSVTHNTLINMNFGWQDACGAGSAPGTPSPSSGSGTVVVETTGLTGGAIFVMIVFIGLGLYIFGFITFNAVRGKRGKELIPHREFWADIPFLVKDGFVFVFRKLRGLCSKGGGGGGGYSNV